MFSMVVESHAFGKLITDEWDPQPLAAAIDKLENFSRIWAYQVSSRQTVLSQKMMALDQLASKCNTQFLTQANDIRLCSAQFSICENFTLYRRVVASSFYTLSICFSTQNTRGREIIGRVTS